ncbi:unnamed protein product [Parascedosporium putredinis]|uniref:CBM1 domain-containing protein n=1 Tax=Parascedosporium putredinis TaxID=1442378 RepID=A0A9P1HAC1_9PEZI|nr:unnamed protein product [Parascedosporium putredinis]CAI8002744.1 unnamed protein product [Parascedosporium putredinis]
MPVPPHLWRPRDYRIPGFGSAGQLISMIVAAHPGATTEAITYPACGGQSSCGGVAYGDSARQGTNAVASQVNAFNQRCPNSQIVLVGYSQGGQIMDNALCGGGDPGAGITSTAVPISSAAVGQIKAAIFMGDPDGNTALPTRSEPAAPVDSTPAPPASSAPTRASQATHQGYVGVYGQQALTFVNGKLGSSSGGGNTGGGNTGGGNTGGGTNCAAKWGQCGGQGWSGATCCASGSTCQAANQWYSQCLVSCLALSDLYIAWFRPVVNRSDHLTRPGTRIFSRTKVGSDGGDWPPNCRPTAP